MSILRRCAPNSRKLWAGAQNAPGSRPMLSSTKRGDVMDFRLLSAIVVAGTMFFGSKPSHAKDALTTISYVAGTWPMGRTLDINIDMLTGKIVQTRFENGDCSTCARNTGNTSSRQMTPDEAKSLTNKAEAVWVAGSSRQKCLPVGHTQTSLTLVRGNETKKDIFITPQCITAAGKALIELMTNLSRAQ